MGDVSGKCLRVAKGHADQRGSNRIHDPDTFKVPRTAREGREEGRKRRQDGVGDKILGGGKEEARILANAEDMRCRWRCAGDRRWSRTW